MTRSAAAKDALDLEALEVTAVVAQAEGVLSLELADPGGAALPAWRPGSHIDVLLPSGLLRQYSLCGEPNATTYRIGVLLDESGRGGSREIHASVRAGDALRVRGPRNHFRLVEAADYLFLAGGIGVTPLLAMAREVSTTGARWRFVYGGRTRASMAFVDELMALPGGEVDLVPQDERGLLPLDEVLSSAPEGVAVYCCGPEPMIRAVELACERHLPAGSLHVERFSGTSVVSPPPDVIARDGSFEVELAQTGVTLRVRSDEGLLAVLRSVTDVMTSCEEGFCGACETRVLSGVPDHRDTILTDEDHENGDTMMVCVGRAKSARLVLDL